MKKYLFSAPKKKLYIFLRQYRSSGAQLVALKRTRNRNSWRWPHCTYLSRWWQNTFM